MENNNGNVWKCDQYVTGALKSFLKREENAKILRKKGKEIDEETDVLNSNADLVQLFEKNSSTSKVLLMFYLHFLNVFVFKHF